VVCLQEQTEGIDVVGTKYLDKKPRKKGPTKDFDLMSGLLKFIALKDRT